MINMPSEEKMSGSQSIKVTCVSVGLMRFDQTAASRRM
jgi:hypothetical protein